MSSSTVVKKTVLTQFAQLISKSKLAHAYIFVGPESSGKSETALAAAKLINCLDEASIESGTPCDACLSCSKKESGNHTDQLCKLR